jgi:hypothetical protein
VLALVDLLGDQLCEVLIYLAQIPGVHQDRHYQLERVFLGIQVYPLAFFPYNQKPPHSFIPSLLQVPLLNERELLSQLLTQHMVRFLSLR